MFSDNIFALQCYAEALKKPFIYGPTSENERLNVLTHFKSNPDVKYVGCCYCCRLELTHL